MSNTSSSPSPRERFDAVIIGAGIAGMYQLHRLREMGLKAVAIEAGTGVGGTWYWNRYPGARVDSQSTVYQYWFSRELNDGWNWSERFPAQPETERYLNYVADHCDLRRDIRFNTRVTEAAWDQGARRWTIHTDRGETLDAQFFITCAGMLSAPLDKRFAGQERFKGQLFHTARWPEMPVDLAGKRVGVVGTGATGIQVIQTIAPQVGQLKVFQRTAQYAIPMRNPKLSDTDRTRIKADFEAMKQRVHGTFAGFDYDFEHTWAGTPAEERGQVLEQLWADGSLSFWVASFAELFFDPVINEEISQFVRAKIRARINDPAVAAKLIPTNYGFGTHRVPLETQYFEAYNLPQVELVDVSAAPIEAVTETGLVTTDGTQYELDVLILATGFDAGTGALTRIDIRGRDGRLLRDEWSRDIRTTMGLQVHGYPNLFTTAAPLAPSAALCNMTTCLQQQVDWISDCIAHLRQTGKTEIEATAQAQDAWVTHHDEIANATLVTKTDSWYMGSNVKGKPRRMLSYAGGVGTYRKLCDEVAAKGYPGFALA
jgi:cation diffusion facilitator CzcD-associated flavoprotein CzcO